MNPETLKALRKSIAHWERMQKNPNCGEEPSSDFCPLCREFNGPSPCIDGDNICPVRSRTGNSSCIGTPYGMAFEAWDKEDRDFEKWQEAAQAEIDFLRSLLPEANQ